MKKWAVLVIALCAAVAAHATDYTLFASADGKTKVVLTTANVSLSTSTLQSGTATLTLTVAGHALPAIGPLTFADLAATAQGITGVTLTPPTSGFTPPTLPSIDTSGIDLVVQAASSFKYTGPMGPNAKLVLKGGSYLSTPFKDADGSPIKANITSFELDGNGSISSTGTITVVKPIQLPVASIISGSMNYTFAASPNQPATFSVTCPDVVIGLSIPGISTNDDKPITVEATNFSFDIDGVVKFDSAVFPAAKIPSTSIKVSLADPGGFLLTLTNASVTMKNGNTFSTASFKGSMTLPAVFTTDPSTNNPQPIVINAFDLEIKPTGKALTVATDQIDVFWNTFHLQIPKAANGPNFSVVFDGPGKGISVSAATLFLPPTFGNNATVAVTNFKLDSGGCTGTFDSSASNSANAPLPTLSVPGFASGSISSLSLKLLKNHLTDFDASGTINIANFGGAIGVKIGCSDSGLTTVTIDQTDPVPLPMFGMQMVISQGTATYDTATHKGSLKLTGSLSVPENSTNTGAAAALEYLKGAEFAFKDFAVDANGLLQLTNVFLDLPSPQAIPIGPVSILLNQIGFGQDSAGLWIQLTGDVSVTDLPISGQIGFDGLKIHSGTISASGAVTSPPSVSLGGIYFDSSIPGVATIKASLTHDLFPNPNSTTTPTDNQMVAANPLWQGVTQKLDVYRGSASISLDCMGGGGDVGGADGSGGGGGPGGGLNFMVSKTGWYVIGQVTIGSTAGSGIQLGQTPLALYAFEGGIGHNVLSSNGSFQGIPTVDYQMIPYPPNSSASGNWLVTAGVRLGTSDAFTAWGDVVLTLIFGNQLFVDLSGRLVLLQDMGSLGPIMTSLDAADRLISGDIYYDGAHNTLKASLNAQLYFPTQSLYKTQSFGIYANGGLELLISPTDKHFFAGGPISDPDSSQPPVIQNPLSIAAMGIQGPTAGITATFNPNPVLTAAAEFSISKKLSGSVGPVGWDAQCAFQAWIYGSLVVKPFSFNGGLGINGSADITLHVPIFGDMGVSVGAGGYLAGYIDPSRNPTTLFTGDVYANVHVSHFSKCIDIPISFPWS